MTTTERARKAGRAKSALKSVTSRLNGMMSGGRPRKNSGCCVPDVEVEPTVNGAVVPNAEPQSAVVVADADWISDLRKQCREAAAEGIREATVEGIKSAQSPESDTRESNLWNAHSKLDQVGTEHPSRTPSA